MRLGNTVAAPFLGTQFASLYLGAVRVPTVPGQPVITAAISDGETQVLFSAPGDGGSEITGYKFYFAGNEVVPDNLPEPGNVGFLFDHSGQELRMSAVNAVGEGPLSSPMVVEEV